MKDDKRKNYLSKQNMFMLSAIVSALRSKDPNTQVGAAIVSKDARILSSGYNGFPNRCSDDMFPWARSDERGEEYTKYPYVVHAEANAILNYRGSHSDLDGSSIYTTLYPCHECAKLIIQSGITTIYYLSDKYNGTLDHKEAELMFHAAGIKTIKFDASSFSDENIVEMISQFYDSSLGN